MNNMNKKIKIVLFLIVSTFIIAACDQNVGERKIEKSTTVEN
jgi:ABC-type Fe3+-citrate transport system substrate-binding protein